MSEIQETFKNTTHLASSSSEMIMYCRDFDLTCGAARTTGGSEDSDEIDCMQPHYEIRAKEWVTNVQ